MNRKTITISLPSRMAAEVRSEIEANNYASASEFFRALLRDYQERKQLRVLRASQAEVKAGQAKPLHSLKDLR